MKYDRCVKEQLVPLGWRHDADRAVLRVRGCEQGVITGLDHVQLALPAGGEEEARAFYGTLLGLPEVEKPEPLRSRGGVWFAGPGFGLHLGVETPFAPAKKAHPAFRVAGLEALSERLDGAEVEVVWDTALPSVRRFYAADPFGNRLEFLDDS
ncbi:VOC family protein [soil metagenome]